MKNRLSTLHQEHWLTRPQGERRLILAAAGAVFSALIYLLLWQPAHSAVAKLHATLPALQVQAEHMREWKSDIEALRHQPRIASVDAPALKAIIEESAVRHQIRPAIESIDVQEPNGVRISLASVSFAEWLDWLRSLQQEQHIRAESVSVSALGQQGVVSIRATLMTGADQ